MNKNTEDKIENICRMIEDELDPNGSGDVGTEYVFAFLKRELPNVITKSQRAYGIELLEKFISEMGNKWQLAAWENKDQEERYPNFTKGFLDGELKQFKLKLGEDGK